MPDELQDLIRYLQSNNFKAEYPGFNWKSAYFFVLGASIKRSLNPDMTFHYICETIN
jgi:hypothetical protein